MSRGGCGFIDTSPLTDPKLTVTGWNQGGISGRLGPGCPIPKKLTPLMGVWNGGIMVLDTPEWYSRGSGTSSQIYIIDLEFQIAEELAIYYILSPASDEHIDPLISYHCSS